MYIINFGVVPCFAILKTAKFNVSSYTKLSLLTYHFAVVQKMVIDCIAE